MGAGTMNFLDYIVELESKEVILIKSAKDLPHLIEHLEGEHKFEQAGRARDWMEGFNQAIAAEFDESCFPVDWAKVAEPAPITETLDYVQEFNETVRRIDEPDGWWSHTRPDMICETCGYGGDTVEHYYACEHNGHLGENL